MTEIRKPTGNILAVLNIDYIKNGLEITNIDSVHIRFDESVNSFLKYPNEKLLLWADKEKSINWLENTRQYNSAMQYSLVNAYVKKITQKSEKVKEERKKILNLLKIKRIRIKCPIINKVPYSQKSVFEKSVYKNKLI
ncbi:hypothetical protein KAZ01_02260 [Candidatus Gracilibacteria bacterium]|nr:hypothetical protein [Candidatus Gracilibacteria bacterium]